MAILTQPWSIAIKDYIGFVPGSTWSSSPVSVGISPPPPTPPQTLLYIPRYLIGTLSSTRLTLPGIPYHLHVIYVTHLQSLKNNFTSIPLIILRPFIWYKCISQTQLSLHAVLVKTWTGKPMLKNNNLWNIVITSSAVCRSDPVLPSVASRVLPIKKNFFVLLNYVHVENSFLLATVCGVDNLSYWKTIITTSRRFKCVFQKWA